MEIYTNVTKKNKVTEVYIRVERKGQICPA